MIEFTNRVTLEAITVEVIGLYKYANFEELYKHFDKIAMGYNKDDIVNPTDMEKYYSKKNRINMELLG